MTAHRSIEAATTVRVRIPSPLRSYSGGRDEVTVAIPVLAPELPEANAKKLPKSSSCARIWREPYQTSAARASVVAISTAGKNIAKLNTVR